MNNPLGQLETSLKSAGYSITRARRTVFIALQQADALTMAQLYLDCAGRADRASVYRAVALFEQLGIVRRVQLGWKYRIELGDQYRPHHHHLTCSNCGTTLQLPEDDVLENRLHLLADTLGFAPQDHAVEIRGLCQHCQRHVPKKRTSAV